jgi:hypothetical protein
MADLGRAPAGRPMALLWMVLALIVVGGFLTWLGMASEPTAVVVVENEDDDDDSANGVAAGTFRRVERDTLAENVGRFAGEQIQVGNVAATGNLGPGIFWGELGDEQTQIPILVRMEPALAASVQVEDGVNYTITGVVQRVTEGLVNTWAEQGEFAGEGEQFQATFADYYIQASAVRPTRGARPEPAN